MPRAPPPGPTAAALKDAAMAILQKCLDAIPCCNLGLTATEFQVWLPHLIEQLSESHVHHIVSSMAVLMEFNKYRNFHCSRVNDRLC